jgi:hypothetical protein
MTPADLIREFLAKGGRVTQCKAVVPRNIARDAPPPFPPLHVYEEAFDALQNQRPGERWSADWWAAYDIGPCDPNREIAEAAAAFVIARDEGLESGELYRRSLCHKAPWKRVKPRRTSGASLYAEYLIDAVRGAVGVSGCDCTPAASGKRGP